MDRLHRLLIESLQACEPHLKGKSTKEEPLFIFLGVRKESPFPAIVKQDIQEELRLTLSAHGLDSGLLREGDVVQTF